MRIIQKLCLLLILLAIFLNNSIVNAQDAIRTNIDFVDNALFPALEVYISVTNAQGSPVKNLTSSNFSVAEDGRVISSFELVPIQNIKQPLAIVIVIDTSGSMGGIPLQNAVQSAKVFVDSLSQQDKVALVSFSDAPFVYQDITDDKELIKTKLNSLTANGETTLYDGIVQGVSLLKNRSERRILVLITDGKDTGQGKFDFENAMDEAGRWAIPIYSIGFGNVDRTELEKMALLTGGAAQIQPNSLDLQSAFNLVLQILREQYLVRYTSVLPADAAEHNLQITIDNQFSDSQSFIALPGEVTIALPYKNRDTVGGDLLLKPEVIAPAPLAQMDVQLDGDLLQSVLSEPFEYAWDSTTIEPGLHTFTFIVKDRAGNVAQTSVDLNVQPPITVNIVAPQEQQVLSGSTKVTADVSSLSGIAKVEFLVDKKVLQTLTNAPYIVDINWDDFSKGTHLLQVKATDLNGFSEDNEILVQVKGTRDIWFLIFVLSVGLAALGIPIGLRRKRMPTEIIAQAKQAILRELDGLNPGKVWPLGTSDVRLGRRRGNDIQLKSPKASREHAIIRHENGSYVLYNNHQDNPTIVNDVKVSQKWALKHNDVIQLGEDVIRYEQQ